METLADFLPCLESLGEREAIRFSNGVRSWVWTYAHLYERVSATAAVLGERLGKGDRLILWCNNGPEWVALFWAAVSQGIVVVPVDAHASAERVGRIRTESGARLLFHAPEAVIEPSEIECVAVDRVRDFPPVASLPVAPATGDDIVQILYTSGTTGTPKGVVHRHRNLCSNLTPIGHEIQRYRHWARPFQPIRFLNLIPLSHVFGQSMGLFIPPLLGGSVVFMNSLHPGTIIETLRAERVSVLVSVPRILAALAEEVRRRYPETRTPAARHRGVAARWWRHRRVHAALGWKFWSFVVGGSRLDEALEGFWSRIGLLVVQGYGLTEASAIVAVNHPFHARRGTLGTGIGSQEIRLGEDGEVLVRGPGVVDEYAGGSARGAPTTDADGWLHTGDLADLDPEGRLVYRGRKKDVIVTADGLNVYPEDVESVLNKVPGVRESVVIAKEGSRGEAPHAVLILDPGVDPAEVVARANRELEPEQRLQNWSIWPEAEFPRTASTYKLQRNQVRQRLDSAVSAFPASGGDGQSFLELVSEATGRPRDTLGGDKTLDHDLGMSSLERIELLARLEEHYGVQLEETEFSDLETLGEIERHVGARRGTLDAAAGRTPQPESPERVRPPRWARRRVVRLLGRFVLFFLVRPLLAYFVRVHTEGGSHLDPLSAPVLFAATHTSHMDVPVVWRALPPEWRRRLAPAVRQEYFFPPPGSGERAGPLRRLEYLLTSTVFNSYPLPQRMGQIRESLRYSGELVGAGFCPLVFPEGKRTEDGTVLPFRSGIGYMAAHLAIPVVPIRIHGLFELFPIGARWPQKGTVVVEVGEPLRHVSGESYGAFASRLERRVRGMQA